MNHFDSLYFKYIAEREGLEVITENHSFITYKMSGEECFLANMFIEESHRGSGYCRKLIEKLTQLALTRGAKVITANIHLDDKRATKTLTAAFGVGFELIRANNNVLLISKKIGGS